MLGQLPAERYASGSALLALTFSFGIVASTGLLGALFDALHTNAFTQDRRTAFADAFRYTYSLATALALVGAIISMPLGRRPQSGGG